MSLKPASEPPAEDTLVRNSRLIGTDWVYVGVKTTVAGVVLSLLHVPYVPLILAYLIAHEAGLTWLRTRLANGDTRFKLAYLLTIFTTVLFWTGLAAWLWHEPGLMGRTCAIGILLVAPVMGASRGYRDVGFLVVTCALPIATLFFLTVDELRRLNDTREIFLTLAPVILGCVAVGRSVLGLRRRDSRLREAAAENSRLLAELTAAKSRLEQVTDVSGVAGWDIELPSRTCNLSPAAVKLLNLDRAPDGLEAFLGHFTPETAAAFQIALRDARRDGSQVDVDLQMKSNSATPRWIRLVGTIENKSQDATRFIGAMQDLSDRIAMLENDRQKEVADALSRLSSRTASEFKKDLNEVSRSLAELGRRASNGTLEHMLLQGMRLSLNRALDTAQSLQAFGASNPIEPGVININKSVSDVVSASSRLMPAGIAIVWRPVGDELPAVLDAGEFELSVLHLILNARDAMERGGTLTVSTGTGDGTWPYVEVRDTGSGMRADVQSRIFEPFFSTKRSSGARGMGLSIVKGFVAQARGKLEVKSAPGAGTTIRLSFPPASREGTMAEAPQDPSPKIEGAILLVHEDEDVLRSLGPDFLREGLILHYAPMAKEAISMLAGGARYDAILMSDMQARTLAGQALAARLPREWPQLRIAVLSDDALLPGVAGLVLSPKAPVPELAAGLSRLVRDDNLPATRPA